MNEQLVVKNFGPIKEATVDFKRVTVFIGPTGGGKSTLAKLAAIFRDENFKVATSLERKEFFKSFRIKNFLGVTTAFAWSDANSIIKTSQRLSFKHRTRRVQQLVRQSVNESEISTEALNELIAYIESQAENRGIPITKKGVFVPFDKNAYSNEKTASEIRKFLTTFGKMRRDVNPAYIPAERIFVSSIEYSWAGLMRDDIGLAEPLLDFSNSFSLARKDISELDIKFLNAKYRHLRGRDFIQMIGQKAPIMLLEAASGIQSVTPLLVLLEHLSRNTEQAQSFIIEEPELNLYPTAQQGLLNWLVEKCTKGENDLTITTHSPYILSHLNLLLYAHQVGNKDEEKRAKVKAIIPEEYWINPDEFAAYYVNGPEGENGVRSLVDADTKLISQNGLDDISGIQATQFDQLLDINSGF